MKIVQLEYFCTVSQYHSITQAAQKLYVTQPAISNAIKELEKEFSVSLFVRSKNHLTLTTEGELFYQKARELLASIKQTTQQFYDLGKQIPPIRIGIPPLLSTIFFPEIVLEFNKLYPEIPVELETPDAFIVIPMDSMLIQQVLMNLLENAALHAEGMTKLTLKVFTVGNRAVFEVMDDGCGIPRERLKTLFSGTDPDVPADSRKHGMGIGLSVCAAIIKAHGGEIKAESRLGEGTTIRFWLETEEIEMEDAEDEQ